MTFRGFKENYPLSVFMRMYSYTCCIFQNFSRRQILQKKKLTKTSCSNPFTNFSYVRMSSNQLIHKQFRHTVTTGTVQTGE